MSRVDDAVSAFSGGLNCSQAVFSTYAAGMGLSKEMSVKVAVAFGGGMGHTGLTCGAVTGALMVIGLYCSKPGIELKEIKKEAYSKAGEFLRRFQGRHGSLACRTLISHDISTDEGMDEARKDGVFDSLCPGFVRTAAEILDDILAG